MSIVAPPYAQLVTVGKTPIFWLPAATTIPEPELDATLHPHERAEAADMRAVIRREEFRRARFLVRTMTGHRDPLPRTPAGAPTWPSGLTGSITHKHGAVGVTIAAAVDLYGLGIDAEDARINLKLESKIVCDREARLLDGEPSRAAALAVVFAFKEAIFKACFPRGQVMFYFHDAEVLALDAASGTIVARLLEDVGPGTPAGSLLQGHFIFHDDATAARYALCAVRIPASARA
jgi:enterobactin synthetase component D